MLYQPHPIGRVCRKCHQWFPRALLKKKKGQPFGAEMMCLGCSKAINDAWADAHPESVIASRKKWEANNPGATVVAIRRWRLNNPEKSAAIDARHAKNHPEKFRAKTQKRNALKKQLPATFTDDNWQVCKDWWDNRCAYCGKLPTKHVLTQDHFYPLSKLHGYTPDNILPACKSCNSSKCNHDPFRWLERKFGQAKAEAIAERIATYFEWVKSHS